MNIVKKANFSDIPLKLFEPKWGSSLAETIIELERLRVKELGGTAPPYIFFQLKNIFQMFESLGSARIEGNRTTLAEFVEKVIELPDKETEDEEIKEIFNLEKAIEFIEDNVHRDGELTKAHIFEIHKIIVDGLPPPPHGEGSKYPGEFRPFNVTIQKSKHIPPNHNHVQRYVEELIDFVNQKSKPQHDLLITSLSHHRMAWIHPFDNGNGREVRMFTYAMLIKQGYQVKAGRILNPTAIFCMNRDRYYKMLEQADSGENDKSLSWCEYVVDGLKVEMEKIDKLLDKQYLKKAILLPALHFSLEQENVTQREYEILKGTINHPEMQIKSSDIEKIIGQESAVQRSRIIGKLKGKGMLMPLTKNGRIYTIKFSNNYLLRGVVKLLERNSFIPQSLNRN
ncbi:Fic family protein [Patescibacteria group bacterium]|nr:Fic family protein [Patescibacteria group bacterium]